MRGGRTATYSSPGQPHRYGVVAGADGDVGELGGGPAGPARAPAWSSIRGLSRTRVVLPHRERQRVEVVRVATRMPSRPSRNSGSTARRPRLCRSSRTAPRPPRSRCRPRPSRAARGAATMPPGSNTPSTPAASRTSTGPRSHGCGPRRLGGGQEETGRAGRPEPQPGGADDRHGVVLLELEGEVGIDGVGWPSRTRSPGPAGSRTAGSGSWVRLANQVCCCARNSAGPPTRRMNASGSARRTAW